MVRRVLGFWVFFFTLLVQFYILLLEFDLLCSETLTTSCHFMLVEALISLESTRCLGKKE